MAVFGPRDDPATGHLAPEPFVFGDFPAHRTGTPEARPQDDPIRKRITRRHAERKHIFDPRRGPRAGEARNQRRAGGDRGHELPPVDVNFAGHICRSNTPGMTAKGG